jgi:biopolymer transport protein TolQ
LNQLYKQVGEGGEKFGPQANVFAAGFREFIKQKRQSTTSREAVVDGTRRALKAAMQRELDTLEHQLPGLATVASVSPYIGLLGTVWGIMNSFRGLASVGQATLAQVAPGIAEALIATAIGLFAAIPAVVAYNRFQAQLDRINVQLETFAEEFLNILQRQA